MDSGMMEHLLFIFRRYKAFIYYLIWWKVTEWYTSDLSFGVQFIFLPRFWAICRSLPYNHRVYLISHAYVCILNSGKLSKYTSINTSVRSWYVYLTDLCIFILYSVLAQEKSQVMANKVSLRCLPVLCAYWIWLYQAKVSQSLILLFRY